MQTVIPSPFVAPPLPPRDPRFVRGPTEMCMLATKWNGSIPTGGAIVQPKIDGIRAILIERDLTTRGGISIEGVGHILADLATLQRAFPTRMAFDGELVVGGSLVATTRHFQRRGRDGDRGHLFLFDALPWWQWRMNECSDVLGVRLERLRAAMRCMELEHVTLLPSALRGSAEAIMQDAARVWARGGEGLLVKDPASLYRRRRSDAWAKVKRPAGSQKLQA